MISENPARLKATQEILLRFITIGRTGDARRQAALQASPAGWPVRRDALAAQIRNRLAG